MKLGCIVQYGLATYAGGDPLATPPPSLFNPTNLDVRRWIVPMAATGVRWCLLTAKHQSGFCLWPTATTEYSVRSSPWKRGQGDLVEEFTSACRKLQVLPGLSLSPGDMKFACWSSLDPSGRRVLHGNREAYLPQFLGQLRELLTGYGPLGVLWLDPELDPFAVGVKDPVTGRELGLEPARAIHKLIRELQPGCLIADGFAPDLRLEGSGGGRVRDPLWYPLAPGEGATQGFAPESQGWMIPVVRVPLRRSWFWTPGSLADPGVAGSLLETYRNSVGRGATLLLNMTPDPSGRIPREEEDRMRVTALESVNRYGFPVAARWNVSPTGAPPAVELDLGRDREIDHVVLEEDLRQGQHIQGYELQFLVGGAWQRIASGSTVGSMRIEEFPAVRASRVRVVVSRSAGTPSFLRIQAFNGSEAIRDTTPGE